MKIYIAGPMTGKPEYNYPAFHAAAVRLRADGHNVLSPAEEADGKPRTPPERYSEDDWKALLKDGIRKLLDAERLMLLPGWEESRGARVELQIAITLNMTVVHYASPS